MEYQLIIGTTTGMPELEINVPASEELPAIRFARTVTEAMAHNPWFTCANLWELGDEPRKVVSYRADVTVIVREM